MMGWLTGSYDGLDITRDKIRYCNRTIATRASDFRFHHADLYSEHYNPKATTHAKDYRFPFPDASFDFVFLMSVFTHMLPEDMEHYLSEISRVLAPGGRSVITYWLTEVQRGAPWHRISEVCEVYYPAKPERKVLYVEDYAKSCYERNGLYIDEIWHGPASGFADARSDIRQDRIRSSKTSVEVPAPTQALAKPTK
jgi:SAM-dependent methyltransferase